MGNDDTTGKQATTVASQSTTPARKQSLKMRNQMGRKKKAYLVLSLCKRFKHGKCYPVTATQAQQLDIKFLEKKRTQKALVAHVFPGKNYPLEEFDSGLCFRV